MTHSHNKRTELPYKQVSKNRCQISVSPISTCSLPRIKECFKIFLSGKDRWVVGGRGRVGKWEVEKSGKRKKNNKLRWPLRKRAFSKELLKSIQSISKRTLMAKMSLNVLEMFSKRGYFALNTPSPSPSPSPSP